MTVMLLPPIRIEYRGRDAESHLIDVRNLGNSLLGLGRILSSAAYILQHGEPPPRRFRPPIRYLAKPPEHGCFPIDLIGEIEADMFQVVSELFAAVGAEVVQRIMSSAFLIAGGRAYEVDAHIAKILELSAKVNADRHEEQMALIGKWADSEQHVMDVLERFTESQQNNLRMATDPIGKSSNEVRVGDADDGGIVVDLPTAQIIRSKGQLKPGELATFKALVDGITAHNRTIGVYLDQEPGRLVRGDLVDPAAEQWPDNIYQRNVMRFLEISAKPLFDADEEVRKLTVIDAKEISETDVSQELQDVARRISESRRGAENGAA